MTANLVYISALLLAVIFYWSGGIKLLRFRRWSEALRVYGLPAPVEWAVKIILPFVEVALAVLILFTALVKVAGALALALLALFSLAILRARVRTGDHLPCGCMGGTELHDYRALLMRNGFLVLPAAVLALLGRPFAELGVVDITPTLLTTAGLAAAVWAGLEVTRALRGARH